MACSLAKRPTFALHAIFIALAQYIGSHAAYAQASDTLNFRRDAALEKLEKRYAPLTSCENHASNDGSRCLWRETVKALIALKNGPNGSIDPDQILKDITSQLPVSPGWKRLADPTNPSSSKKIDPAWDFPFLTANLLFRAAAQFSPPQGAVDGPSKGRQISASTLDSIREVFWLWASTECRLADASSDYIWALWSTENHDAQRSQTCWSAAELLSQSSDYQARPFADGSTASSQLPAWTAYFAELIRARANAGISIEFFSPTYSKYFLSVFYNIYDFSSNSELRALSGRYLSLWWALWAHEQINGVHGGGKARFYFNQEPNDTPMAGLPWVYFGTGMSSSGVDQPAHAPMLLSNYVPPPAVSCIIANQRTQGSGSETWSRAVGLVGPTAPNRPTSVSDKLAITRYTYTAPGYVMGSVIVPRLRSSQWAPLSSQNRWSGVVLDGGVDQRVFAAPARGRQRSMYNAVAAVQNHGTQIIGRLPPPFSREAGAMEIRFGERLPLTESDGWIFADGAAYVAARPAFGDYTKTSEPSVYRLTDSESPVIIQAGSKRDYATLASFQSAVMKARLKVDSTAVEFVGLDGAGRLRFNLTGEEVALHDNVPLLPPENWLYKGAFITQRVGERHTDIACGTNRLRLEF